jgi:2-amino-4-hydroxy-6-hydroxymethyldihydropteridine diphosphokinase
METAFLLLGGNIGDREKVIYNAISLIKINVGTVEQVSSLYETEPWGMLNAKSFLNIAVKLTTKLAAFELLDAVLKIEEQLGRKRNAGAIEYESRPIDIDIMFYGSSVIQTTQLTIPHPRIQSRKFVLVPLCEIAAEFIHPVFQKPILTILNECQDKLETVMLKPYIL